MLSDMLLNSKFDPKEMQRERKVIIEEIKMYEENPIMHIEDIVEEAMFDGHVLGRNIAGTPQSMTEMKREDVIAYRDAFYKPENMVIVASGNLPSDMMAQLEATFGTVPATGSGAPADDVIGSEAQIGRVRRQQKDLEQIQLMLGFPTVGRGHADEAPLKLLAAILGGTMSSRLFVEVREKRGLCYTVRAGVDGYQDVGMFTVRAGLDAKRLEEAMQVITDELRKAAEHGVTADELAMVKDNVSGGLSLRLEDSSDRAEFYGRQLLFMGMVEEPQAWLKKFEAVTLDDIARVAKDYLKFDKMSLAAIGPFGDDETLRKMIPSA